MNNSLFLRISRLILHYGLFASIVHLVAILLYYRLYPDSYFFLTFTSFFRLLEHSLMSFICVLSGALLFFYIFKKNS